MRKKIIYFVPILLIIISIITSILAFTYEKKLENGFIYIDDDPSLVEFDGEYFTIIGNLGEQSTFITVDSLDDYLLITIYDSNESITREYSLIIKEDNLSYSKSIISEFIGTTLVNIDEMEDYLFTVNLEEGKTYVTILDKTINNIEDETIDLVLVNIPENLLNMKTLNEGISFTTMVFAGLAIVTTLIILFVKKDN